MALRLTQRLLLAALAVAALQQHDSAAAAVYDRDSAVRSLALLGSGRVPSGSCIGVLVGATALAAPAHCVVQAQTLGQPVEWAAFGFTTVAPPSSASSLSGAGAGAARADTVHSDATVGDSDFPTHGVFQERERIRVARITLHPDFTSARTEHRAAGFRDHDWAVLELEHAPVGYDKDRSVEPLPFLDDAVTEIYARPLFRALFVARDSLELTWIDAPRLTNSLATCGLDLSPPPVARLAAAGDGDDEPLAPEVPPNVVCATLSRPESLSLNASAAATTDWLGSLLLLEHHTAPGYFVAGVGTSHVDALHTRSFSWAEATGPDFLGGPVVADARWVFVPPFTSLIGTSVPALSPSMQFIAGVRTTRKGSNFCGGSLIAPAFVLTAGHCVDAEAGIDSALWVSVGSPKTTGAEFGEQIRVQRVVRHPMYDAKTMANDLALLELKYASVAPPVRLFNGPRVPSAGQIFGYGATAASPGAVLSDILRVVDVVVEASNEQCALDLQLDVHASMFCAGGQAGKDACDGDSGGPLVVTDAATGASALLGVISYGRGCGIEFLPGVYANVSYSGAFLASVVPDVKWTAPAPRPSASAAPTSAPGRSTPAPSDLGRSISPSPSSSPPHESTSATPSAPPSLPAPDTSAAPSRVDTPQQPLSLATSESPPASTNTFVLPSGLAPSVKSAVVAFLVGDSSQISAARAKALLERSPQLVFSSTASLAQLERILSQHSAAPLHQRRSRFADAAASTSC